MNGVIKSLMDSGWDFEQRKCVYNWDTDIYFKSPKMKSYELLKENSYISDLNSLDVLRAKELERQHIVKQIIEKNKDSIEKQIFISLMTNMESTEITLILK